jgi:HNH endonuclease
MTTFNELLHETGLDPSEVILVRHSGRGATGLTPHDLWLEGGERFDRYQSTQRANKPIFRQSTYWASFVTEPSNTTLFVGIYSATLADSSQIDWICPLSGQKPGEDRGEVSELYELTLEPHLAQSRSELRITWTGGERSWVQYAHKNDKSIEGQVLISANSVEGKKVWRQQIAIERSPALTKEAKQANSAQNLGACKCAACDFEHSDFGMFDAHHLVPLAAGERITTANDFAILCPTCHRRAHRGPNRLLPYSVAELRVWNSAGRR